MAAPTSRHRGAFNYPENLTWRRWLTPRSDDLCRAGPCPRRLRPQGNRDRRDRNAGPDGAARGIRRVEAAQGRADHRLAAHDHPDRGADRDADRARRRRSAGHRATSSRPRTMPPRRSPATGIPVFAIKGETLEEYWDYVARIFDWGQDETCNLILDDGGDATMFALWGARVEAGEELFEPTNEEEEVFAATLKRFLAERPGLSHQDRRQHQGRQRRNHHRRPPPLRAGQEGQASVPGDQRQRQRDQVEVRQSLRLPREPGRRDPPRHRRHARRQGRLRRRLRRCRQGQRAVAAQRRRARAGDRSRSDLRASGGDGRL